MGNARNLANLLSNGDVTIKEDDIADGSINTDKLGGSITGAKFADGSVNLGTQSTGTVGTSNGGFGITSLGTAGQAIQVNSGGTAFEFVDKTADLTDLRKDIAILAMNDSIQQSQSSQELTAAITDTYTNEDAVTNKSQVALGGGSFKNTGTLSGTTVYINPWGTTGTINSADGQTFSAITVTDGTGAWESGGTSFTYVDMVSSAPGSGGHIVLPQGTTYDFTTSKTIITLQVITKAGGSGPNMSWNYLKDVATSYTSYNSYNRSDSARSNISFNSTTGAGQQMRITYDPVGNEDVIIAEKRTTNSGTWTGATETYGTTWATESVSDGIVFGSTFWRDSSPHWTVRMGVSVEESSPNATGSYESTATTISSAVDEMSAVVLYKDTTGTATLNTDFKVSVSSNNGSNFTQLTLTDTGLLFSTGVKIATSNKVSTTSGTQLKYKVEFANQSASKKTECAGVSLLY